MSSAIDARSHHADRVFLEEDLAGARIEEKEFQDCEFRRCSLAQAVFLKCRLVGCTFRECDLSLVKVPETRLSGVRLITSKAIGIEWTLADWQGIGIEDPLRFSGCVLDYSTFLGLSLKGVRIVDCSAREVDFREADLSGADFSGTDLTGSLFSSTVLSGADLSRARNYTIVPGENRLGRAKFSLPEALALLHCMDIDLVD